VNPPTLRVKIQKVFPNNLFHFLKFGLSRNEYYDDGSDYGDDEEEYHGNEWEIRDSRLPYFSQEVYSESISSVRRPRIVELSLRFFYRETLTAPKNTLNSCSATHRRSSTPLGPI